MNPEVAALINRQITAEAEAAQIYLQMSLWCEDQGLEAAATFFRSHVPEEMAHRDRLVDYMIESSAPVRLEAVPAPQAEFSNLVDVVHAAYEHEQHVTEQINAIARAALDANDFATFTTMQWFIAEQREEEGLFRSIIDYITMSGFDGSSGDQMVNVNEFMTRLAQQAAQPSPPA